MDLNQEGDANGFLCLIMIRDNKKNKVTLTQTVLTDQIVKALVIKEGKFYSTHSPTEYGMLSQYQYGNPWSGAFNCASVLGLLLYLTGHSWPDIYFSVHQCEQYNFFQRRGIRGILRRLDTIWRILHQRERKFQWYDWRYTNTTKQNLVFYWGTKKPTVSILW